MLYDKRWDKPEVKADPSLGDLISWLETRDAKARYPFWECSGLCLLGQYMADRGIDWTGSPDSAGGDWTKSSYRQVAEKIFGSATALRPTPFDVLSNRPHTFGGALKRARTLLKSQ